MGIRVSGKIKARKGEVGEGVTSINRESGQESSPMGNTEKDVKGREAGVMWVSGGELSGGANSMGKGPGAGACLVFADSQEAWWLEANGQEGCHGR